ncbi:MAG TPA: hypothetical protein VF727_00875 [Allosphingosinicella sp.]|jgi:hypothetical protein
MRASLISLLLLSLSTLAVQPEDPETNFGDEKMRGKNAEEILSGENNLDIPKELLVLFELPRSDLETECSVASLYPNGQAHPRFYSDETVPEHKLYYKCLVEEARRSGWRNRWASPTKSFPSVGTCYSAEIVTAKSTGRDDPDEAQTEVTFDIGLVLKSFSYEPGVGQSRVGDKVRVCVYELPSNCPAASLYGIKYEAHNLRTGQSWIMRDHYNSCSGEF